MRIVVVEDHEGVVRSLACYRRLDGHEVTVHRAPPRDRDELLAQLEGAEAVVIVRERTAIPRELIERLPALRLVSVAGRATKHVDVAACTERGIAVATAGHGSPRSPAEMTVALMLAGARRLPQEVARLRAGRLPEGVGTLLAGRTLALLGYGTIAALVAPVGRALGMRVVAYGGEGSRARAAADGHETAATREAFFEQADVLSLHLRLSERTRGSVTAADLGRMQPSALLVNTARAELIAPGALLAALRSGRPGAAALDVHEVEPLPPDDPLLAMDNVICTPHLGWATRETFEQYFGDAFANVAAYAAGAPTGLVNPEALARR